jgi:hypothetical protein
MTAHIFDQPPIKFQCDEAYERPFHIQVQDGDRWEWVERHFARRCDASRWARRQGYGVKHWYTI